MMNDGEQTSLTYVGDFDNFDVVFTSWSNDYHRDWFKVSDFNNDSEHGQRDDINELISDANNGSANAQAILDGELAVEIEYKHNNRYYTNEGYQFNVSTDIGIHALTLGYRDMEDSESRVQAYEYADQSAKSLSALYGYRGLGGSNNRLRESSATSYYLEDTMDFGKLAVTVGYRSEDYDQRHRRWDEGAGPNLTAVRETIVRDTFAANDHTTSSLGATYELNENMVLVAGFHQGMTPMFGADPEEADNTELGVRYSEGSTNIEAFYFSSEYSNLAAECTLVSGASCDANESAVFSGGAADVSGLEFTGSWIFEGDNGVTYPIAVTYTSTDSEFLNSSDSDYFGTVAAGDSLPYIPDSQMSLVAGFITDNGLSGNMRLVSVGSSCSLAACGTYNQIEEHSYVDLNLRKAVTETVNVYMIMENVFDSEDIISRAPSEGARSQKPATLKVGFSMNF
jgi:Fe(3+) dicitrate transport protein